MATAANTPGVRPHYDLADLSIALITGLFFAMIALSLCTVPLAGKMVGFRDFVAYYATGCQLVHHADPAQCRDPLPEQSADVMQRRLR